MDQPQYSSLVAALAHVPDPRSARGKQLEWTMILGVLACALLSGQRGAAFIAQWAARQRRPLLRAFQPARGRLPSESTLRRALHRINVVALERHVAAVACAAPAAPPAQAPRGHAIDGKHVRGAGAHGQPTVLVSLVAHRDAQVVAQTAVAHKRHESQAVPEGADAQLNALDAWQLRSIWDA